MTSQTLANALLAELPMSDDGTGHVADCGWTDEEMQCRCMTLPGRLADAVTAHLAAILADPETVEAVARAVFDFWVGGDPDVLWSAETDDVRDMYRDDARAAIGVIAGRQGVAL